MSSPTEHDPLCSAASPGYFRSVTFGGQPFPCDCPLIARVRADERATAVDDLTDLGVYLVRRESMRALRAKVEGLPRHPVSISHAIAGGGWVYETVAAVRLRDVLALLDEADR